MRSWNDALRDTPEGTAERNRLLRPILPLFVGASKSKKAEAKRGFMTLDWLVRVFTPAFLDLTPGLADHSAALRGASRDYFQRSTG